MVLGNCWIFWSITVRFVSRSFTETQDLTPSKQQRQRKTPLTRINQVPEQDQVYMGGDPPSDVQLGKGGEGGKTSRKLAAILLLVKPFCAKQRGQHVC